MAIALLAICIQGIFFSSLFYFIGGVVVAISVVAVSVVYCDCWCCFSYNSFMICVFRMSL